MKVLKRINVEAAPAGEEVATFKMKIPEMEFIITKKGPNGPFTVNPNFDVEKMNRELEKKFAAEIDRLLKKHPDYDRLDKHYKGIDHIGTTKGIKIPYDYNLFF